MSKNERRGPRSAGNQIRPSAEEDGKTENAAGEEAEEEVSHAPSCLGVDHIGGLIVVAGLSGLTPSIPWLGKLPGDILVERGRFRFYFTLVTSILLSILLTAIMWLVRYFAR